MDTEGQDHTKAEIGTEICLISPLRCKKYEIFEHLCLVLCWVLEQDLHVASVVQQWKYYQDVIESDNYVVRKEEQNTLVAYIRRT